MGGGEKEKHLLCAVPVEEPPEILEAIRKRFPSYKVTFVKPGNKNLLACDQGISDELWKDVTVLFTLGAFPSTPSLAPRLEFVQMLSAGVNHIRQTPIYSETEIPICNASGIHGPAITEWVMMTTLVSAHFYHMLHEWQQAESWGPPEVNEVHAGHGRVRDVRDMVGQRMGILGYGSIGRQVGRVAAAMGMEIYAYTAHPRPTPESKRDRGYIVPGTGDPDGAVPAKWFSGTDTKDLHAFLSADLDVLVISTPLTSETRHLIGLPEFELLARRNAFLVNISRGQIMDQDALIKELRSFDDDQHSQNKGKPKRAGVGRAGLRGAALDVADPEPLPKGHPLFTAPNCIVTPHISPMSVALTERAFDVLQLNMERHQNGEDLVNAIDREKGYRTGEQSRV